MYCQSLLHAHPRADRHWSIDRNAACPLDDRTSWLGVRWLDPTLYPQPDLGHPMDGTKDGSSAQNVRSVYARNKLFTGDIEMKTTSNKDHSLACDLSAIPAEVREEHVLSAPQLFALAQEVHELPDGFAIRFVNEPGRFMAVANFIENERLCCPFFRFGLELEPNSGPLWLQLTGGEGIKELVQNTLFDGIEDKTALKQLIQTGGDSHLDEIVAQTALPLLQGVLNKSSEK